MIAITKNNTSIFIVENPLFFSLLNIKYINTDLNIILSIIIIATVTNISNTNRCISLTISIIINIILGNIHWICFIEVHY